MKALIATAYLKMKGEGTALVITNNKERKESINKFVKNTGWGEVIVLDFSSKDFISKFISLTK